MALKRGPRIDINRRADLLGDAAQWHVFGMHDAVTKGEMVHRSTGRWQIERIVFALFGAAQ